MRHTKKTALIAMAFTAGLALTACTDLDHVQSVYGPPPSGLSEGAELEGSTEETGSTDNTNVTDKETEDINKETEDMDNPARIPEVYGPPV